MKLFSKANRYFGLSVLVTLILSSFLIFYGITYLFQIEAEEKLAVDELRLIELIKDNSHTPSLSPFFEIKTIETNNETAPKIKTIELFDPLGNENEQYLELSSIRKINGLYYSLKVRHATVESEELMFVVIVSFLGIMLISFMILFFINRTISLRLWRPFNSTLEKLKAFSLEKEEPIQATKTNIIEFDLLNESLEKFSSKLIQDYKSLREFTENASHEIQTPLSVILLNLEETLQSELDENTSQKVYASYQAALRLSRLNEKLLLLTKLDNQQFNATKEVDVLEVIKEIILEFTPLFHEKSMQIETDYRKSFYASMDSWLASILISNLISNALKYGDEKGKIEISVDEDNIKIANSLSSQINVDKLFERFHKQNTKNDSLGLGLSISKKIVDTANLSIQLKAENNSFIVEISKK